MREDLRTYRLQVLQRAGPHRSSSGSSSIKLLALFEPIQYPFTLQEIDELSFLRHLLASVKRSIEPYRALGQRVSS